MCLHAQQVVACFDELSDHGADEFGGGVRPGSSYGQTDDYCYNITNDPVHVHDLHATMLHLMGIDHKKLVYKFQGRYFRLTDVHGKVVQSILA